MRGVPYCSALAALALACMLVQPSVVRAAFEVSVARAREAALALRVCPFRGLAPVNALSLERKPVAGARADSIKRTTAWVVETSACELYGLPEARSWAVAVNRSGDLPLSVRAGQFGGPVYRERAISLYGSVGSGENLSVAAGLRALGLSGRGVMEAWCSAVDAGVIASPLSHLRLSCEWSNVGGASIGGSPIAEASVVRAEIESRDFSVVTCIVLEPLMTPSSSFGVEQRISPQLALRAGAATEPQVFAAGFGVRAPGSFLGVSVCVVDFAWQWNPDLGVSAFVTMSIAL